VLVCVDDDVDRARDLARPWLALYLGAMGARGKNFYVETAERLGHGESARRVQELWSGGDRAAAAAALDDGLIDGAAICTSPAGLDERLADYERRGVDTLLALPFGDRPAIVRALARSAAS
jgi:alkanesulfonate monooxygenase SsuD/methylene tetrahydromethanopterin reductase-like flavin-dependent oxidoreductase (luciferase family)